MRSIHSQIVLLGFTVLSLGCASLPAAPQGSALAFDMERVVKTQEQLGWGIDRIEARNAEEDVLASVCRASEGEQKAARTVLEKRLARLGGPAATKWQTGERSMTKLKPSMTTERSLKLLEHGLSLSERGDCPFWWKKTKPYEARQNPMPARMVSLESSGRAYAQIEDGALSAGGGGASRLVLGGRIAPNWSMFTTLEFGGGGRFDSIGLNQPIDVPDLLLIPAALIQLRRQIGTWYVFNEIGPMMFFTKEESTPRWGVRNILGAAAVRLRIGPGMPIFGAQIGLDWIEPGVAGAPMWQIFAGGNAGYILPF